MELARKAADQKALQAQKARDARRLQEQRTTAVIEAALVSVVRTLFWIIQMCMWQEAASQHQAQEKTKQAEVARAKKEQDAQEKEIMSAQIQAAKDAIALEIQKQKEDTDKALASGQEQIVHKLSGQH